ncbi:hypothetical protein FDJ20_gp088 [Vibrio phage Thalassa]|uniref:Uncharacterized protein n=1 Tax=Vibrio phage Thalassa TaxID=2570301 RepID=A0A2H5BH45_9CAUD|nr:hypothetical protein FDJ20_gp088 [Vibrio phage Thalassa]AUG85290.1 hypothetical protein THALASSA_88 [Vibrio phage Thalassa]
MAKATIKKEVTVTLTLTQNEARYLKGLLQNWLGEFEEPADHKELRNELFNEINQALGTASHNFR